MPHNHYDRLVSRQSGAYPPALPPRIPHPKDLGYLAYLQAHVAPFPAGTEDASFWHEGWEDAHDRYLESLETIEL